jgi:hypothetical protein
MTIFLTMHPIAFLQIECIERRTKWHSFHQFYQIKSVHWKTNAFFWFLNIILTHEKRYKRVRTRFEWEFERICTRLVIRWDVFQCPTIDRKFLSPYSKRAQNSCSKSLLFILLKYFYMGEKWANILFGNFQWSTNMRCKSLWTNVKRS